MTTNDPVFEGEIKLKEVWFIFLEMIIRFMNNRFVKRDEALEALRMELGYRRHDYDKLLNSFMDLAKNERAEPEEIVSENLKPIRNIQPSWSYRAQQFEKAQKAKSRQSVPISTEQIDELEKEVGL